MTNDEAAAWARAYAEELAKGGWNEDAARYRRQAAALEGRREQPTMTKGPNNE